MDQYKEVISLQGDNFIAEFKSYLNDCKEYQKPNDIHTNVYVTVNLVF